MLGPAMNLFWRILKRLFSSLFLAVVTLVGAPLAFGATVLAGLIFLPLPASIPIPKANPTIQPTILYDRYGKVIATLQQSNYNIPVTEAQIPQVLKEAVISDEDRNYYHESGVNLRGTVRALWADIRNRAAVQGGSTITQQYVKLAYTNAQRTLVRKVKEAILASQLAREASKDEILYRYLTLVYFGDGNNGIGAAAQNYFHVPVQKLNVSQAATLAGLIPAPSARAPEQNLPAAESFRELVLKEMYQQGYLTAAQYQQSLAQRLALAGSPHVPKTATIVYPIVTAPTQYPDFVDYTVDWLLQRYPASQIYGGGLRIQTTLVPAVQQAATNAVDAMLSGSKYPLDMALAAVEPQTGFVPAIVAGRDFPNGTLSGERDNLALGGCPPRVTAGLQVAATCWSTPMVADPNGGAGRQPGSSWKPFTLATAFEQGIPPSQAYPAPYVYNIPGCTVYPGQKANACQIHNDEGDAGFGGYTSLSNATAQSINTVYAQLVQQVGCSNVADTARKVGIETAYFSSSKFPYCASYALGEQGVSPLDMASAYGVFADHGQRAAPTPILEIVNAQGKVLLDNIRPLPKATGVLPANVADNVTNALQGVIQYGTGTAAQIGRPAAGKTGTTSNTTDAWFVGYTPTLSAAVWMGNADSDSTPIGSGQPVLGCELNGYCFYEQQVYGGTFPAIVWKEFMQAALQGVPVTNFNAPAPIITPQAAAALRAAQTTTTTIGITPGPSAPASPTPLGGPYEYPAPTPFAPTPTTPTTVPPPTTTTTIPKPTTTTATTSTTLFGGPAP
jgi:penicillin-binding protein 1A